MMHMIYSTPMVDAFTGEPLTRTKETHPYNYQPFETYNNGNESNSEVWSDRLWQWDSNKYNKCCEAVWGNKGQLFYDRNPSEVEHFLRLYFDNHGIVLNRIVESCNQSNGFPVWYFGFSK